MAFDADRQHAVLYGGSFMTDTWTWDGTSWQQLRPVTSPPNRLSSAMVYDATRRRMTLFDGVGTWVFLPP